LDVSSESDGDASPVLEAGSNDGSEAGFDEASCVSTANRFCAKDLEGFPFVNAARALSDYCLSLGPPEPMDSGALAPPLPGLCDVTPPAGKTTMHMTREPGKLCLSGWVAQNGWALISLELFLWNRTFTEMKLFDAAARGITQVHMSFDSQRVDLNAGVVTNRQCPTGPKDCSWARFRYTDLSLPGPVDAPFAAFKSDGEGVGFDTSLLGFLFSGTPAGPAGDYSFCISDFRLLDVNGQPVNP
jgi:hypothetical protein